MEPPFALPLETRPMEARHVAALPASGWQFEPKWDGFRCLAFKSGREIELRGKSGKSLSRYFPEIVDALAAARPDGFVLDGELAIASGGTLSFAALQDRLHPASSRIQKLATATPAFLILFDCLASDGEIRVGAPLHSRRAALEALHDQLAPTSVARLTPTSPIRAAAEAWLAGRHGGLDGVIAKPLGAYLPGARAMLKVKTLRTADCVVGGYRTGTGTQEVASLLLGLYNAAGELDHVGFTSGIEAKARADLTRKLERLRSLPGFTGKTPGGPSRWANARAADWHPLRPELVVEVRYDQVTENRFRHGTALLRFRPDKPARSCTLDQLAEAAETSAPLL